MKRVLVIRPGALGDTLLAFPVLQKLKPEKIQIQLVSHPAILELAQVWNVAERAEDYGAARWSELFSPGGIRSTELRQELAETDLVVCWLRDSEGLVERNLRATGCGKIIVAAGRPVDEIQQQMHIVEYLGSTLGLDIDETLPFRLATGLTPLQQAKKKTRIEKKQDMVAIHPGSGGARKCWPIERFVEVIQELQQQQIPILLLSGPVDGEKIEQMRKLLKQTKQGLVNIRIMENAPLSEICQEFLGCCVYLGNDAGITHLAALFGLPTLVLFGPSNPNTWRPVGNQVSVIYEPQLELLGCDIVMQILSKHLGNP